jgi:hypothetical protein
MTIGIDDLIAAIERDDVRAVVYLLRGASESERRAVNSAVRKLVVQINSDRAAAVVAGLGTATGARQASELPFAALGGGTQQAVTVLTDRNPAWLKDLPNALLAGNEFRNDWSFVRALVRAGLVVKPDIPEYTTRMPTSFSQQVMPPGSERAGKSVEQQLLDDRELLDDEVFRLFRVEGAAGSLYWADSWIDQPRRWEAGKMVAVQRRPEATWRSTLARLARQGLINFDRVLDECIAVFLRDFRPTHFGWYVGLHDELAPTLEEMAPRASQYERLLAATASIGVGMGQKALEQLMRASRLELPEFVHASAPALNRAEKGIVVKQLKLLELAYKSRPELASLIIESLAPALAHERADIREEASALANQLPAQQRALELPLERPSPSPGLPGGDEELVLSRAAELAKGSIWAPQIAASVEAVRAGAVPPPWTIPVGPGAPLPPPISDPEELVEVFTRLVEDAGDPILIERAIAGAVRTARIPLATRKRMTEPLAKRAREQLPGWPSGLTGGTVREMIASVAYTWSTGVRVAADFGGGYRDFSLEHSSLDEHFLPITPTGVLAVRCIEAIDLIARGSEVELLSEPTHERGAIAHDVFLERAQKSYGKWLGPAAPKYDLEMAALRIRPGEIDLRVTKLPRQIKDRMSELLRASQTAVDPTVITGEPVDRWKKTGSRVVLAKVSKSGHDATILATLTNLADPVASYLRLAGEGEYVTRYGASINTWPLIAPWHPELTAAHLLRPLSRALLPGKHDYGPSAVGCLLHPDTPLGGVGHVVLAMGCIGAEADTRTRAADVFAAAAADGRLQPSAMSEAILTLARFGVFQAKRFDAALGPLRADSASAMRLAQSLRLALGPLLEVGVRDVHVLARLAASLGAAHGVFPNDSRLEARADQKGGTELAKALRALAVARASIPVSSAAASVQILNGLLDRAEPTPGVAAAN